MQEQYEQHDEKKKRLVIAFTVAGTLVFLFLLGLLIVQFVKIGVGNAQRARYDEQNQEYERVISENEKDLHYYQTQEGLFHLALENGWKNND